ncbi:Inner membrane protein YccS [Emticicia aquatica]|uniref:Inner membrane protein YccS n=1 Tax=Emticicia aquatica TaxID=1681835 RepID=A0ABN8EP84_9BACT|nr:FUSC family membrane protein [Emticicia aquatica]CAH0994705.1 Inner membrane protein YccS [Emticicia aquatica]
MNLHFSPKKIPSEIKNFVLSQYFGDGLRITFGVVFPSLVLAQFGLLKIGISLSLGAVCTSIADTPGPITHRRNAMFLTMVLVTIISLLTSLCSGSIYLLGALIVVLSFIFSMFYVYGTRATSMGVAALLVMIIGIDDIRPVNEILFYSLYIFLGGFWYSLLSLSIYQIMPYRLARLSLAESVMEIAGFMRIKAGFYKENMDYDENYKKLIEAQITVNEKLDAVREQLFKNQKIVQENSQEGRLLLVIFVDMVDLYEQIMSTFFNYQKLHKQFDHTGILIDFENILNLLAEQMEYISISLKDGSKPEINLLLNRKLQTLKFSIDTLSKQNDEPSNKETFSVIGLQALKNIEFNIENILLRIKKINGYFKEKEQAKLSRNDLKTTAFTNSQVYDLDTFLENLNLKSENFRHALRVSGMMLIGFIIAQSTQLLHSNWILLTIMVIMKPAYSLTKERNLDRLIGTIGGAFIGMIILNYVTDNRLLFAILLVCMLGTYSFQRKTYLISVVFMTPFILILFEFLGMGSRALLIERVYDTAIGGVLAFIGSYVLLPNWEHEKLKKTLIEMLEANLAYYHQVSQMYFGENYQRIPYKIVRKEVFVRSANLASSFQRMFSEPKHKQISINEVHKFSVLNHLLSSYVATLALYSREHFEELSDFENLQDIAQNTENLLKEGIKIIEKSAFISKENIQILKHKNNQEQSEENMIIIPEQFMNIQKVAYDICKISERIKL